MYRRILDLLNAGQALAMATVTACRGSTPREVGAKMLVVGEGQILGTVGGGCGEAQVLWDAVRCLSEGRPKMSVVDLTGEITEDGPTRCGGIMEVFIDPLLPSDSARPGLSSTRVAEILVGAQDAQEPVVLATLVATPDPACFPVGIRAAIWFSRHEGIGSLPGGPMILEQAAGAIAENRSRRISIPVEGRAGEAAVFLEVVSPPEELVIVGAGHIAVPLARMAKVLDFEVTVIDDRSAFANRARFPEADRIIAADIGKTVADLAVGPTTYLVLITRGHTLDHAALMQVIHKPVAYIGMIGSQRRVRAVFDQLRAMGVAEERIQRVYAPIGLRIGAETPAEIATSILAELVAVRRKSRTSSQPGHLADSCVSSARSLAR
jgi:xanthine dehydrogenase accessory factor